MSYFPMVHPDGSPMMWDSLEASCAEALHQESYTTNRYSIKIRHANPCMMERAVVLTLASFDPNLAGDHIQLVHCLPYVSLASWCPFLVPLMRALLR